MSAAVPKVVTVLNSVSSPALDARRSVTMMSVPEWSASILARVGLDLGEQFVEARVAPERRLASKPRQQMATPLAEVQDSRREAVGVERQAHAVGRRNQQLVGDALEQQVERAV